MLMHLLLMSGDTGQAAYMACTAIDITEHREMNEALRASEREYRTLCHRIPGMVYRGTPDWSSAFMSKCQAICGYTFEEIATKDMGWFDIVHPDDRPRVWREARELEQAERSIVQLSGQETVDRAIIVYINRLSDALFEMARFENFKNGFQETVWKSEDG